MYFAEDVQVPSRIDTEGERDFLSQLKIYLFGVTNEVAREPTTFLLTKNEYRRKFSSVGRILMQFLKKSR